MTRRKKRAAKAPAGTEIHYRWHIAPDEARNPMPSGKCPLCLQIKDLVKSHFMPAALYKKTQNVKAPNKEPILITARGSVQTSRQMTDYLLCGDCEKLFNENGERYAMSQVADRRRFPLLATLRAATPTKIVAGFNWYNHASVSAVDRGKLGYFALSVFWRAAVHSWEGYGESYNTLELGPYQETLRQYLLGQTGFPADVVLFFIVCTDAASQDSFHVPSRSGKQHGTTYTFQARGINFFMTVGKQMLDTLRSLCSITGGDKWIVSRSCEEKMLEALSRLCQ